MSRINFEVPILDDEGNIISTFVDAIVDYDVENDFGNNKATVNFFEVETPSGSFKRFYADLADNSFLTLFLRAKEYLETSEKFQSQTADLKATRNDVVFGTYEQQNRLSPSQLI